MGPWSNPSRRSSPFHERTATFGRADAARRIEAWTRARFSLAAACYVLVTEERTVLPGFPEVETRVHFGESAAAAHHFRLFKPMTAVEESDLPPAWMRPALAGAAPDCNCC